MNRRAFLTGLLSSVAVPVPKLDSFVLSKNVGFTEIYYPCLNVKPEWLDEADYIIRHYYRPEEYLDLKARS